jgi:hypothetical protein
VICCAVVVGVLPLCKVQRAYLCHGADRPLCQPAGLGCCAPGLDVVAPVPGLEICTSWAMAPTAGPVLAVVVCPGKVPTQGLEFHRALLWCGVVHGVLLRCCSAVLGELSREGRNPPG